MNNLSNFKLVLVEGIPGSGKSTTAQYISRCLEQNGIPSQWFCEENLKHPAYAFDSLESMSVVLRDLSAGRFEKVIESALAQWKRFALHVQESDRVTVVDSCLFGYLSWSLFPNGADRNQILEYIQSVEETLESCNPMVVYFYQDDIESSLKRIIQRRGNETEQEFISNATECKYGKRNRLSGFAGLVSYWEEYRRITDEAYACLGFPKITIENSRGEWTRYYQQITDFLGVSPLNKLVLSDERLAAFTGRYQECLTDNPILLDITIHDGGLLVSGHPLIWMTTPLLPISDLSFHVSSLPFTMQFVVQREGLVSGVELDGPDQFSGSVKSMFRKLNVNAPDKYTVADRL